MAILDFVCVDPSCDAKFFDRSAPAGAPPPSCMVHGPMEILWTRPSSVGFSRPVEFEDDDGTVRHFNSVQEIHAFERQTEREVASGRRKRPFVFREFSQSLSSHRDVNVFQDLHPQVAREKLLRKRRGRPIISVGGVDIAVHGDPNAPAGEE